MANTNPGGIDFNTSPYFDDYDEDKKFARILYRPGRAHKHKLFSKFRQSVLLNTFSNKAH